MAQSTAQRAFVPEPTPIAAVSAVINPYALAEVVAGRKINWKKLTNAHQVLEDILQTPYEELFDPKYGGPLYTGLRLNEKHELEQVTSPLLDVEVQVEVNDLETKELDTANLRTLGDLRPFFKAMEISGIEVRRAEIVNQRYLQLTLRLPEQERLQRLARVFTKDIVTTISPILQRLFPDWTPPGGSWGTAGEFFHQAAEFFDPVQGAVANCYFIAALSAVAWARPYVIRYMNRATGTAQSQFSDMIPFMKPDSGGQVDKQIEVSETVPLNSWGGFIYARSSETGETWPAIYEKAFAKFKTGIAGDHPDITATAWGDCVLATSQLTGGQRSYFGNAGMSADDLWNLVRSNSLGGRTFNPMTCWTYATGDDSPDHVNYSTANIVGSHCYTVLGWAYQNGRKYIVLRNPWGNTEATVQTLNATLFLHDVSWWRPIALSAIDGTFAIEASAFKSYYAGIGVVK